MEALHWQRVKVAKQGNDKISIIVISLVVTIACSCLLKLRAHLLLNMNATHAIWKVQKIGSIWQMEDSSGLQLTRNEAVVLFKSDVRKSDRAGGRVCWMSRD